ncbi:MAG TPA: T9SS type A sorting domain-containing protein, partial [Flavobacteriaceae bacterium]|nr:T9SS type A sorting domain-containing protein [Flavobacteriaceae bacterium]
ATGDFDQDGKTDIIITGFDENDQPSTIVYRNTSLLSLGNSILNNIEIYPNPSLDKQITIENKDNISLDVEIYSIKGNKVYNTIITKTKEINLNTLSNGVYLLKLTSSNSMTTKKVILK